MSLDVLNSAVRPIVTLMVVAVLCYAFVTGQVAAEAFLGVASMVLTFWFSQRQAAKDSVPPATPNGGKT